MAGSLLLRRQRSRRGLPALFGLLGEAAENDNALLVCFLGTFSASLCKLDRAQMNNEGFGSFPFTKATIKVLFFAVVYNQLSHIMAEVGENDKTKLMGNCYDFIKV